MLLVVWCIPRRGSRGSGEASEGPVPSVGASGDASSTLGAAPAFQNRLERAEERDLSTIDLRAAEMPGTWCDLTSADGVGHMC